MSPQPQRGAKRTLSLFIALAAAAVVIAVVAFGILSREHKYQEVAQWTDRQAIPTVDVVRPARTDADPELVLPGTVQAWYEAPIYARVPGYLKRWDEDIGARVKAGQVLAEIDTPDLDQQLLQAKADLATAKANEALAELTARRWQALLKTDAVARQDVDEKVGDAAAKTALVAAAEANVKRLQAEESFKRIVAPFDGVVAARNTDVGALINVGSASGLPLFKVADIHKMRVYVRVPQAYSSELTPGMTAELHVPQFPNKVFPAKLVTTAKAIAIESRTLLVELDADNPKGELWPGAYAEVHFNLPSNPNMLTIPTSALIFREHGLEVAVVGADGKVVMKPIKVGRNLGTQIEVVSGLTPADKVIDSPPDSLGQGDTVDLAKTSKPRERVAKGARTAGTGE